MNSLLTVSPYFPSFSDFSTHVPQLSALDKLPRLRARELSPSPSFSLSLARDFARAFFRTTITVGSVLPRVLLVFGVREYAWTRISRLARMVNFRKQKLPFYWVSSGTLLPRRSLGRPPCPCPSIHWSLRASEAPLCHPRAPFRSFTPAAAAAAAALHSSP